MKVGLVYDPVFLQHDTGPHIENAQRLTETLKLLEDSNVRHELTDLSPRPATMQELMLVHHKDLIDRVDTMAAAGGGWLDGDTVTSPASYDAAISAAGGMIRATEEVVTGRLDSAFALVRPPGHHATPKRAMGFCLFNNTAIAARYALKNLAIKRIMIVDFDVHHGNGTQDAFYDDPAVLYLSMHQFPFYPGTGDWHETGSGKGKETIINVPLPPWCGDEEYLEIFRSIVVPAATRYKPQLILVSAGYDAHWADPISSMQVTVSGYAEMARILRDLAAKLCNNRLVFALEGGYHTSVLAHSIKGTLEILSGRQKVEDPFGRSALGKKPTDAQDFIKEVARRNKL